jgi:hypothetical protein
MRLVLRVVGTWMVGLALVLLIIDGTRSLSANAVVLTPLGETWRGLDAEGLAVTREFFATRFFGALLGPAFDTLVTWPGFAVLGVPGVVLALLGRSRKVRTFVRQDQF